MTTATTVKSDSDPGVEEVFPSLDRIYEAAEQRLGYRAWSFLEGGAGHEFGLRANRAAFNRWALLPHVLSGAQPPSTKGKFLDLDLRIPVMTAPFGADRNFHSEGQLPVGRACQRFGIKSFISAASTNSLEAVAENAPEAAKIFQLHPVGNPRTFEGLAMRAEKAGYRALCATVDSATRGWRERILNNGFVQEAKERGANYPEGPGEFLSQLDHVDLPLWTWDQLKSACSVTTLPLVVKGILTVRDARAAVAAGAAAIVVSNHGGRQLDSAPAALDQLEEIVQAVGGSTEIVFDSGIRRGSDIIKALCLGASSVLIGRSTVMGLAAAGEAGVYRVLELMELEMLNIMVLLGVASVRELDRTMIKRVDAFPGLE